MIGHVVSKKETPEEWAKFARLWGEYYERGLHRRYTQYNSREAQDAEKLGVYRWVNDGEERTLGGFLVGDVGVVGNPYIDDKTIVVNSDIVGKPGADAGAIRRSWIENSELYMVDEINKCIVYRSRLKDKTKAEWCEIVESLVLFDTDLQQCFLHQSKIEGVKAEQTEFRQSFVQSSELENSSLEGCSVLLSDVSDVWGNGMLSSPCVVMGARLYPEKSSSGAMAGQVMLRAGTSIIESPFGNDDSELSELSLAGCVPSGLFRPEGSLFTISANGHQAVFGLDLDKGEIRLGVDEGAPDWFWGKANEVVGAIRSNVAATKSLSGYDYTNEKMQIKQERLRGELGEAVKEVREWVENHS
jgi:hypothetical protein